ncbi:MurR/RpiR family transcriptional regulator [Vagococcus sp. BWB3-3]|uniref:MurR/RpiR family transcriptional regulator n=1 Tax=Vagococcus allomyrinae TaxID=2794353 RepID=A0A940PAU0_9ENTE|nr:MurR/RpiR family transcriptional regulator [Vagococcus allomyrinae]MBP1044452.1 MurR/RpiR family transcriptional regulator [Vagococcus allomyrinae]
MFDQIKLKSLTELEKEIALYISAHLEQVAYMRVREIASATHSSPATIIRMSQKLGFDSFPELRARLKQELSKRKQILGEEASRRSLLAGDVFPADFDQKVAVLVERLKQADFIHCIGLGASGIMAEYAARQFSTLGYRSFASTSTYFPYLAPKKDVNPNQREVCLCFSVSGETVEIVHIAKLIANSHIYTVSITNKEVNTLSQITDLDIYYHSSYDRVHYNADLSSQLPVVYFIETLVKKLYLYENRVK